MGINTRLPFPQNISRFWPNLIPAAVFGSFALALTSISERTRPLVFVGFFAATFCAMWPWLTRRATYSFWGVAVCVYFLGGVFAAFARFVFVTAAH